MATKKVILPPTPETIAHYRNPIVRDTLLRVAKDGDIFRWLNGGGYGWYRDELDRIDDKIHKYPMQAIGKYYDMAITEYRTLYTTLQYFDPELFKVPFDKYSKKEQGKMSVNSIRGVTLGIDIDSEGDIHDPAVKEAVEKIAAFYVKKLKKYVPNSVYVLYSGGGIYVLVHHGCLNSFFELIKEKKPDEKTLKNLIDYVDTGFNIFIRETETKFFEKYPQYRGYVKADAIMNTKRVFKCIYSVHAKHPYAVIPLDVDNIKIDFEAAKFPLSESVLETGKPWYKKYDSDDVFYNNFLKPYMRVAKKKKRDIAYGTDIQISTGHFTEADFPPCVLNTLAMDKPIAEKPQALAFIVAFLGQMNVPEEEAIAIFEALAERWDARQSNIFTSWYRNIGCASCKTLTTAGAGYPHLDGAAIGACKPNTRCLATGMNPAYYVDNKLYGDSLYRQIVNSGKK